MITENDVKELEEALSKYGINYNVRLERELKISQTTIRRFFRGQKIKNHNSTLIYEKGLDILEEEKNKEEHRKRRARQLIQDEGKQSTLNV